MGIITEEIEGLSDSWKDILKLNDDYLADSDIKKLECQLAKFKFHPCIPKAFRPFKCLQPSEIKVVIVGQDPYLCSKHATGIAFSTPKDCNAASVRNIHKAITKDIGGKCPADGNLEYLVKQGVFLMNASFTYPKRTQWHKFSRALICALSQKQENIVFMLWGADAKKMCCEIDRSKHLALCITHPASRGRDRDRFLNCKHFSAANKFLECKGKCRIKWLPEQRAVPPRLPKNDAVS